MEKDAVTTDGKIELWEVRPLRYDINGCLHAHFRACMRACVHACVCPCMRVRTCIHAHLSVRVRVRVCASACTYACWFIFAYTCSSNYVK